MSAAGASDDIAVRMAGPHEAQLLDTIAQGVLDWPVDPDRCAEFFTDARHHLAVALENDIVVGIASAIHYVHPDKHPEMYINEICVVASHRRRGVARRLMLCLFEHARHLDCRKAWLFTEAHNDAARRLYESVGGHESDDKPVYYSFRWDGIR